MLVVIDRDEKLLHLGMQEISNHVLILRVQLDLKINAWVD